MRSEIFPKNDTAKQTIPRFSQTMVGDKTDKAFDSADLRHSHKFNDIQPSPPELENENEALRLEIENLKREIVTHSLVDFSSDDGKIKMLERENKERQETIDSLTNEIKMLQEQSHKTFSMNLDDMKAAESDNVQSAGDSQSVPSKISNKLEEKAVSRDKSVSLTFLTIAFVHS